MKRRSSPCPCCSGRHYEKCCGLFHKGQSPPSPEALMRARFAAYAKGRASFIMTTTDPRGPAFEADEQAWRASILSFSRRTRFTALEIIGTSAQDGLGWVRFRASLQQNGRDASFEERSTFRLEGADWLYVDGQIEPTRDSH